MPQSIRLLASYNFSWVKDGGARQPEILTHLEMVVNTASMEEAVRQRDAQA